jgi:hypothetical protein
MALVEVVSPFVEAALIVAPELLEIPILGKILLSLTGGHAPGSETKALEQLEKSKETQKATRTKVRDRLKHRVIKVSDALQCCEDTCFDGRLLLHVGKALVKTIAGDTTEVGQLQYEKIERCMVKKMLTQSRPKQLRGWKQPYHRPARGHGIGKAALKPLEGEGEGKVLLEKGVTEFIKGLVEWK